MSVILRRKIARHASKITQVACKIGSTPRKITYIASINVNMACINAFRANKMPLKSRLKTLPLTKKAE